MISSAGPEGFYRTTFFTALVLVFFTRIKNCTLFATLFLKDHFMNWVRSGALEKLRSDFGRNKLIPPQYELPILLALSKFPELKTTRIVFMLRKKHPVPYGTTPSPASFFKPKDQRTYVITILEQAKKPTYDALFKNLPFRAQVGVIGHELTHVVQYNSMSVPQLLKNCLSAFLPPVRDKMEKGADLGAIQNGLGKELYALATYIRKIPGYVQKRKEINKYYLKPFEILKFLSGGSLT
jgi:hypothetical protein